MTVPPTMDREEVAQLTSNYDVVALPVVDEHNRILGVVTVDDVIDALVEEHTEDVQRFGGMQALDEPYMQIGLSSMIRKRGGWLSILLVGEMATATVMKHFEIAATARASFYLYNTEGDVDRLVEGLGLVAGIFA